MSKYVRHCDSPTTSFVQSMVSISELPPPELRKGNRVSDIVRQQKEEIRRKAFDEGYVAGVEQGEKDGFEAAKAEADERYALEIGAFVDRLLAAESQFEGVIEQFLVDAENQLAALAVVIAERLMRIEMEAGREAAVAIAKDAITEVRHGASVRIRVNPFEGGEVAARQAEIISASQGLRSIEIVRDPTILGGCIIESDDGMIDARIESALQRLVEATKGVRPRDVTTNDLEFES